MKFIFDKLQARTIRNGNAFLDRSHVDENIKSYIIMSLEEAGYPVNKIETWDTER